MDSASKVAGLQRLLDQADEIKVRKSTDPVFKIWKNMVERTLIRIYGQPSPEVEQFHELRFFYSPIMWMAGDDFTHEHRERFDRDLQILMSSIRSYIEEIEHGAAAPASADARDQPTSRVFISHAKSDAIFVEELVELLEIIGLTSEQIFCTSLPGYGVDLGNNFLDGIKAELLNANAMVLFVLTRNFYASPVCLCEMGATWVLAKQHVPVLVPPFDFDDIEGVFPFTEGLRINDPLKLNLFREMVEDGFGLTDRLAQAAWERKRDRALGRINAKIADRPKTPA